MGSCFGEGKSGGCPGGPLFLISQYLGDNAVEEQFRVKLPFEADKAYTPQFVFPFESGNTSGCFWAISRYVPMDTTKIASRIDWSRPIIPRGYLISHATLWNLMSNLVPHRSPHRRPDRSSVEFASRPETFSIGQAPRSVSSRRPF